MLQSRKLRTGTFAMLLIAVPLGTEAQEQGMGPALPQAQFDELSGLYHLDDGRRLVVFNLVDQVQSPQLVAIEPGSGVARTLTPASDREHERQFLAGSAWFVPEPSDYSIRFLPDTGAVEGVRVHAPAGSAVGTRAPFVERDVGFPSGELGLAGTLVLPPGPGPHPVMVLVHGSGPLTRRVPRYIAHLLADRGVGAFVYDKRGTGASEGAWQGAAHEDLARDAEAALDAVLSQPDVDGERVGLFGSSEGGYVAPVVAARDPRVSLLVCRVCPALPQHVVSPDDQRDELARRGFEGDELDEGVRFHKRILAYVVADTGRTRLEAEFERLHDREWMQRYGWERVPPPEAPYWQAFRGVMLTDPRDHYKQLSIPALVILGEEDARINANANRAAFLEASPANPGELTVEVIPGASHGMLVERVDSAGNRLPYTHFAPRFHDLVVDWIASQFDARSGSIR